MRRLAQALVLDLAGTGSGEGAPSFSRFLREGWEAKCSHNGTNNIVSAASPPALAKNARTRHPELWCGKEKQPQKLGQPRAPPVTAISVNLEQLIVENHSS